MNSIIKWGIIGLGNVAHEFAKSFYNIKNAKLIAIASKTHNKLSKFKDEFNIDPNNCYGEYEKLLKDNHHDIKVQIANDNSEGQIVLSGKIEEFDKLIIILKKKSIKNIKLPVSAPFHCSLMSKATNIMSEELNKLSFLQSENKLISNVTANEIRDTDELKDLLIKQIENRVRWRESVINMINNDVNHFIEIGPGKVLSGLVKRINREVKISTINNQGDIESLEI